MANHRPRMKRADIAVSPGINSLIHAANKNDRFKLLEDDAVLSANLINPIHPLFRQLEGEEPLRLALQLASHFLLHDRLLDFFVPLLYGREMHDLRSAKNYLCDPLAHASKAEQAQLLSAVRQTLQCLADRLEISFVGYQKQHVYARTIARDATPPLTSSCCRAFQGKVSPKIEVTDKSLQFYSDADGYAKASRCAQYRHDFLFATTLVHEVVHAVGVMRRGDLIEPHYRLDYPETEWGYAWENFMFGSVFNPQDKTKSGTHILMRRVWANSSLANTKGGKEYCDVSMSWIAQWFRTETWSIVAERGPTAIAPPTTHFKIQVSLKLGAWMVYSDSPGVRKDIADLYTRWQKYSHRLKFEEPPANGRQTSHTIHYNERSKAELQESNVPIPPRICALPKPSLIKNLLSSSKPDHSIKKPRSLVHKLPPPIKASLVAAYRESSSCSIQRKRRADADSDNDLPKATKRKHQTA